MENKGIVFLCTDGRMEYALRKAGGMGYSVIGCDVSNFLRYANVLESPTYAVLPINSDKYMSLADIIPDSMTVFGGMLKKDFCDRLLQRNVKFYDYMNDEILLTDNAEITAEAAVFEAMKCRRRDMTLLDMNILVTGYGRIAKALTRLLIGLGCRVTVACRSSLAMEQCASVGIKTITFDNICGYDLIFNTVPSNVIGVDSVKGNTYIELASPPFGIDEDTAKDKAYEYRLASGLPGKYAPESAGEAIWNAVHKLIRKEEMLC